MSPEGAMDPMDQELFARLGDALSPASQHASVGPPPGGQLDALRVAVVARNWRWVPLLAHLSWLTTFATGTVMAFSAVAVALAISHPGAHHQPPAPSTTVPGVTAPATVAPGGTSLPPLHPAAGKNAKKAAAAKGAKAAKGEGNGSAAGGSSGSSTTSSGGSDGTVAPGTPAGVAVNGPGNQVDAVGQAIVPLVNSATGGNQPYTWSATGLPAGLTIDPSLGTISGTPSTPCSCTVTVQAADTAGKDATASFTWSVYSPLAITSTPSATFTVGVPGTFTVTSGGVPTGALSETGPLPSGVTFTDNGNGTATLSGTPAAGTAGTYPIVVVDSGGVSPNASQIFTLTVDTGPPVRLMLSPPAETITSGGSQPYTAAGFDASGDSTGDVTTSTTFTIAPNGTGSAVGASCTANTCTAAVPGNYTVTGTYGVATGTAALTVTLPPWTGPASGGGAKVHEFQSTGFYIGEVGDAWRIAATHENDHHYVFSGTITLNAGSFSNVSGFHLETADTYSFSGGVITFKFNDWGLLDGLYFMTPPNATSITFTLSINGVPASASQIFLGPTDTHPPTGSPFTIGRSSG
jgi:hypothetical protein